MSAADYADHLVRLISQAEDEIINKTRGQQNRVARLVSQLLGDLTLSGGKIKVSAANRQRIRRIRREAQKLINSDKFYEDVKAFLDTFQALQTASYSYFRNAFSEFNPSLSYDELRAAVQSEVIQSITVSGANEGLTKPVERVLQQATRGGASVKDLRKTLREEIQTHFEQRDNEEAIKTQGKMERYVQVYVRDSLNQFARNLNQAVTEDLGLDWYLYAGGRVKDTRDFCVSRLGKYWHRDEVEAWGKLGDWQGKRPGTNPTTIFQNLGGYNCLHQLIPVSEDIVPRASRERVV